MLLAKIRRFDGDAYVHWKKYKLDESSVRNYVSG